MGATPVLALPYPDPSVSPDGPYSFQQLAEAVEAQLVTKPRCRLESFSDQTLTTGVTATVTFTGSSAQYDTNAMADIANNRILIKTAGWYRFAARTLFAANATGLRGLLILQNGNPVCDDYRNAVATASQATIITLLSDPILCAVNDAITAQQRQDSGGNLITGAGNGHRSWLSAHWAFKS